MNIYCTYKSKEKNNISVIVRCFTTRIASVHQSIVSVETYYRHEHCSVITICYDHFVFHVMIVEFAQRSA